MDSRLTLPVNTVLDDSYCIVRVVGSGGFGITYEAEDIKLNMRVALKEYYPLEFGDRDSTMSVKPKSDRHRQTFQWGRSNFLQEARTLARFEHPSIVRVTRVFEANSTAYMVMRFEQGQSFEDWLAGLGRSPTQEELDRIVAPRCRCCIRRIFCIAISRPTTSLCAPTARLCCSTLAPLGAPWRR
jgi:serine/threonine protein kinase